MNLYLYSRHNYYNRRIVSYSTIDEYQDNFSDELVFSGINFNPNDGISTTQVINYDSTDPYFANREESQSYCIVVDDSNRIISRWWITGARRIRQGQIEFKLLRDVIADYKDIIISSPAYITKGYINSSEDPAIFNNEDMTYNQIKTSEQTLRDASKTSWYLLYLKEGLTEDKRTITIPKPSFKISGIYENKEQYPYASYMNPDNPFIGDYDSIGYLLYWYTATTNDTFVSAWRDNGQMYYTTAGGGKGSSLAGEGTSTTNKTNYGILSKVGDICPDCGERLPIQDITSKIRKTVANIVPKTDFKGGSYAITGAHTGSALNNFLAENGKCYQFGNTVYKVKINKNVISKQLFVPNSNVYAGNYMNIAVQSGAFNTGTINGEYAAVEFVANTYYMTLEAIPDSTISYTLPLTNAKCEDSPYEIIAVPKGFIFMDDESGVSTNYDISQQLVNQMIKNWSSYVLDAQLLPYAPVDDLYFTKISPYVARIHLQAFPSDATYYTVVGDNEGEQTIVLYINQVAWTKTITDYTISVPDSITEFKVANETDFYRLCSPNYNGQFEFSATKNGGVKGWNITYNYRPFTPYIKVAPIFGRLYGRDFGDARGLICGGDFSITQVSNEWNNYQLQNKNYLNIFDRQIENLEVNNSVQHEKDVLTAITGTIQGGMSGLMAGGMTGNPYLAAAGAAGGVAFSGWGGYKDVQLNEKLRQESVSFAKDQFGYQMQNIQAIPYSLAKVGVQNADYKQFPFVEYFTCTEVEKQALTDKLTWNGFTIMRIGYINNFLKDFEDESGTFIQAKPIKLVGDSFVEESNVAEAISAELRTGVYFV